MTKVQYLNPPIGIDETAIQGDVLIGLQKTAEVFSFFTIVDVPQFRVDLDNIVDEVADLRTTRIYEKNVQTNGNPGNMNLDKMNIAFTFNGLKALGLFTDADRKDPKLDPSFTQGQRAVAATLGDDLKLWLPVYANDAVIHGVILMASWRKDPAQALAAATDESNRFIQVLQKSVRLIHTEPGKVRSGTDAAGVNQLGHEHFGFADGVSQPGVEGLTTPDNPQNPSQGFPGQDLVKPGEFVFGNTYAKEVPGGSPAITAVPPRPWMTNGSYMVFRRLNQDVGGFHAYVNDSWHGLASGPDQFAARMIGRWPNGSPLVRNPQQSNPNESEKSPEIDNDFDFGPINSAGPPPTVFSDKDQKLCPFSAHIRRMYMRADAADDASERHRILRAGIAFGDDTAKDKGLLFVCYQTSIKDKFEFIQKLASDPTPNDPTTGGLAFAAGMVPPPAPAKIGFDLVLGKAGPARQSTWATGTTPVAPAFVTATGGVYLFMPSIPALRQMTSIKPFPTVGGPLGGLPPSAPPAA